MNGDPAAAGYIYSATLGRWRYDPAEAARRAEERRARAAEDHVPAAPDYRGLTYTSSGLWRVDPNAEPALPAARMVEVSEAGVSQWRKELANDILQSARADSDLAVPDDVAVRWFRPESKALRELRAAGLSDRVRPPIPDVDDSVGGFVNGDDHKTVWLRSDVELGELAESVAHELFHSMTIERALEGDDAVDLDDEAAAKTFGLEIRRVVEEVEREVKAHDAHR